MLLNYDKADMWNGKIRFRPDGTVIPGPWQKILFSSDIFENSKISNGETAKEIRQIETKYFSYEEAEKLKNIIVKEGQKVKSINWIDFSPEIILADSATAELFGSDSVRKYFSAINIISSGKKDESFKIYPTQNIFRFKLSSLRYLQKNKRLTDANFTNDLLYPIHIKIKFTNKDNAEQGYGPMYIGAIL